MWQDTVSGTVGAMACATAGNPFDVAKSRMQAGSTSYRSLPHCLGVTLREEGVLALYRGLLPSMSSAVAENATGITVNRAMRRRLGEYTGRGDGARYSGATEVALGGGTGVFTSIAICPFEVVKVRQQLQLTPTTILAETRSILREEGAAGLFRGLGSLILRDVPWNALFYGSYEYLCTLMMRAKGVDTKEGLGAVPIFFAGGLAGQIAWSIVLPFDVVKTRLQSGTAQGPLMALMARMVAEEGWASLFKGWSAAVVRAFPANAGLFLGVEFTSRALRHLCGTPPPQNNG